MGSLFAWRSAQNRIRATHDRSSPEAALAPALSDGARRPPPPAIEVGHGRFSDAISKHITKHTAAHSMGLIFRLDPSIANFNTAPGDRLSGAFSRPEFTLWRRFARISISWWETDVGILVPPC